MTLTPARSATMMLLASLLWTLAAAAQTPPPPDTTRSLERIHGPKSGPPTPHERARHQTGELMSAFAKAWSADDSTSLFRMFQDDVQLFMSPVHTGRDAVQQWARENMKTSGRLSITPLRSGGNADTLYQSGRWVLGLAGKGTQTGVHTFVFTKTEGDDWKISSMYILDDPSPK